MRSVEAIVLIAVCSCSPTKDAWEARRGTPHESFFRLPSDVQTGKFEAMSRNEKLEIGLEALRREPRSNKWLRRFACEGPDSWTALSQAAVAADDPAVGYIIDALRQAPEPTDERTRTKAIDTLRRRTGQIGVAPFRDYAVSSLEKLTTEPKVLLDCSRL